MHLIAEKGQVNVHGSALLYSGLQKRDVSFFLTTMYYPAGFVFLFALTQLALLNAYAAFLDEQLLTF